MVTLLVIGGLLVLFGMLSKEALQRVPLLFGGGYVIVFAILLRLDVNSLILSVYAVGGLLLMMVLNLILVRGAARSGREIPTGERKLVKVLALSGLFVILFGIVARLIGYDKVRGVEGAGVVIILLALWQSWIARSVSKRKAST